MGVYMNFSYLIFPQPMEKGTMMCSGCGFGAGLVPKLNGNSSLPFSRVPAKEHIHQRISSQVGKKLLILKKCLGKSTKESSYENRIGEHSRGLRPGEAYPVSTHPAFILNKGREQSTKCGWLPTQDARSGEKSLKEI